MATQRRAENELRPVQFELDYILHPEGSVLISMGDTKVLCNATVEGAFAGLAAPLVAAPRLGDG